MKQVAWRDKDTKFTQHFYLPTLHPENTKTPTLFFNAGYSVGINQIVLPPPRPSREHRHNISLVTQHVLQHIGH